MTNLLFFFFFLLFCFPKYGNIGFSQANNVQNCPFVNLKIEAVRKNVWTPDHWEIINNLLWFCLQ